MTSFIVTGFDGSEESKAALRWAFAQAAELRADLRIVHCLPQATLPASRHAGHRQPKAPARHRNVVARSIEHELAAANRPTPHRPAISSVYAAAQVDRVLASQARGAAMLVLGASSPAVWRHPATGPVAGPLANRVGCTIVVVDRTGHTTTLDPDHPVWGVADAAKPR